MRNYVAISAFVALWLGTSAVAIGDTFVCQGEIIEEGMQKIIVEEKCGKPTELEGDQWVYDRGPEYELMIIHFDGDVVSLIEEVPRD